MSSGFISEAEIEERRKIRQEEWDKVRQPDQPKEAPEETYDNRTLFERLQEQKQKKDLEYEESHKLKNMIKGLDNDEIEFLDLVDRTKMEHEKRLIDEDAKELQEFRNRRAALKQQTENVEEDISSDVSFTNILPTSGLTPHNKALANLVKKRPSTDEISNSPAKKLSDGISNPTKRPSTEQTKENSEGTVHGAKPINSCSYENGVMTEILTYPAAMQCVGILPGIGSYISDDSSDFDNTSGSELEDDMTFDLRGQKVGKNVKSSM